MAEETRMMGEQMPAGDQKKLSAEMPEEARQNLMSSSEEIKDVLMLRLTEMTADELQRLDKAITPEVIVLSTELKVGRLLVGVSKEESSSFPALTEKLFGV